MPVPTVHSERLGFRLPLGHRPSSQHPDDAIDMKDVMRLLPGGALPAVPSRGWGWGYDFGPAGWGMDGNGPAGAESKIPQGWAARTQGAGDCFFAAMAHKIRELNRNAGRGVPLISDLTVIEWYAAYTATAGAAYDPQSGANDNGTDPGGAYTWMARSPLKDDNGNEHPLGQVINLEPGNWKQHLAATMLFENVGVGLALQQAQVDQFDRRQPWAYVPGSPEVGGHEVLQAGPDGLITWGERHAFEPSLIEHCNDESQATLTVDMFNRTTGLSANHYSEIDLERYVNDFVASRT